MPVLHASPRSRSRRVSLQFLFPFLTSGSLPPSFPTNLPQVCPISGSRPSHIHLRSGLLARLRSPRRSGAVVFSPAFPVASLPFLSSGSFHLSSTVSPLPFRQVRSFPFLLSDSGSPSSFRIPVPLPPFGFRFYHPKFGVRFCGPRFAPKRAPHHSPEAATLVCAGEALKCFVE